VGFVYPVIVAGGLTIEDPRHVALAHALLVGSLRAIDLLDAFNLPLDGTWPRRFLLGASRECRQIS
jgi:antibiotic biosynthesis monooxygenase (ABM) superfamily enzyme